MHFIQRYMRSATEKIWFSDRSRNLIIGRRGPDAAYFFRSGDCFDAPSHIPYDFVVREENKVHIVNIES